MKKFLITLLALGCILSCALGLSACGDTGAPDDTGKPNDGHVHSYQWVDNGDGTHKQHCSVSGCDAPDINVEKHAWSANDECEKCGAVKPTEASHTHDYKRKFDDAEHWLQCDVAGCTEKTKDRAAHDAAGADGSCSVCGYKAEPVHAHAWSQSWESNETHHWHDCTAEGCTVTDNALKDGYAAHDFTDGNCVCGKPAPHTHIWAQSWESNETHHWHDCTAKGCTVTDDTMKDGYDEHNYDPETYKCVCGKKDPDGPTEGLEFVLNQDNESYSVTGIGTATGMQIIIPSVHEGKPVTVINDYAFNNCANLTDITIPDSVTTIKQYAFGNCSGLTEIIIPDSVTSIANYAFSGCSSLASITLPFVGSSLKTANDNYQYPFGYIFGSNSYTDAIKIKQEYYYEYNPDRPTSDYSYYYIPASLTSVTLTCGSILYGAFSGCTTIKSITLTDSLTDIGSLSFNKCYNLEEIKYTGDLKDWFEINGLPNLLAEGINDKKLYINGKEIAGELVIPDDITAIGEYAFYYNNLITSVTIGNGVTSIGERAFGYCASLASVTIGNGVTSIGEGAFDSCPIETATIPAIACGFIGNSELKTVVITSGSTIADNAFNYCVSLTSVTIPDSVTTIGGFAFHGCSSLTSITIPASVTNIDAVAFGGCSSLTEITLPFVGTTLNGTSSTHFGYIFGANTYKDQSGYVPKSLKSVIITGGTNIASYAFKGCSSVTSVTIPGSVTNIEIYAFIDCSSLEEVKYTGNIADWCKLSGIYNLIRYGKADKMIYIDGKAITGELVIPDGVTSIVGGAFMNYALITGVTISNSVTIIDGEAFQNCSGITSITFKGTIAQWNDIKKGYNWNYGTGDYTITCTDGKLDKNGNEITE